MELHPPIVVALVIALKCQAPFLVYSSVLLKPNDFLDFFSETLFPDSTLGYLGHSSYMLSLNYYLIS